MPINTQNRIPIPERGVAYRAPRLHESARVHSARPQMPMYGAGQSMPSASAGAREEAVIQARQDRALTNAHNDFARLSYDAAVLKTSQAFFEDKLTALERGSLYPDKTEFEKAHYRDELRQSVNIFRDSVLYTEHRADIKGDEAIRLSAGILDATAASKPLKESDNTTKYAALRSITFKHDDEGHPMYLEKAMGRRAHALSKRQAFSYHEVPAAAVATFYDQQLHNVLSGIPTGVAAQDIEGTKIELNLHGLPGILKADSMFNDWTTTIVDPRDIAVFLDRHLKPGDYKYSLVITLSTCHGASANQHRKIPSALDALTQHLESLGNIKGVRLTGTTGQSRWQTHSNTEHLMGARTYGGSQNKINKFILSGPV